MTTASTNIEGQDVRSTNRRKVLSETVLNGPTARTEISRRTGLAIASVSRISRELIQSGLVIEGGALHSPNRPGRRLIEIEINPKGGYVLGISINAFQQFITLADLKNQPLAKREVRVESIENSNDVLHQVANFANEMIRDSGIDRQRLLGGSVAVAGAIDPKIGRVRSAPTMGWEDVDIGNFLTDAIQTPIHVENLPNAMMLAETRFGIGRGFENVVLLNAAFGIAGSLLLDNRLIRGNEFSVGLFGTMNLWRDASGNRLSVDDMAGGRSVLHNIHGKTAENELPIMAQQVLDAMQAAESGDVTAQNALRKSGQYLAEFVETIAGVVRPKLIVVSGPLSLSPFYIDALREKLVEIWSENPDSMTIQVGSMTSQAAARWLALNEFLLQRDVDLELLMGEAVV